MEGLLIVLNMVGTIAFAISGAMTGMRKGMDILGVMTLGMITAVGGGMMRDIILGDCPPQLFCNPIYAIVSLGVSALAFIWVYLHLKGYREIKGKVFQNILALADAVGLGVFTVVGAKTAMDSGMGSNGFLVVCLGVLTGVGGGILRDIMAGDRPYIFVKHIYACASLAGSMGVKLCWDWLGETRTMVLNAIIVVAIRVLAAHYHWNLPRMRTGLEAPKNQSYRQE